MAEGGPERITTGIAGLDTVLGGGLLRGGSTIVQGSPGAGKTILANQICFHHARSGGRALYVTLLAESHDRLAAHLAALDFFDRKLIPDGVYYVSALHALEEGGLDGVARLLRQETASRKASFVVFDGLLNLRHAAQGSGPDFKRFLLTLQGQAAYAGCTTLLLTNGRLGEDSPEHTVVDAVLDLTEDMAGMRSMRHLRVRKSRGGPMLGGLHQFEIGPRGVTVHPRLEAQYAAPAGPAVPLVSEERISSGAAGIDALLGGGIPVASTTLVFGPTGSGKTTLGLHFLAAARPGEPALHFGFYETPPRLRAKAASVGRDLRLALDTGQLELLWQPPTERLLDALGHGLLDAVTRRGVRRLVVDGLSAFRNAAVYPSRLVDFFTALTNELRRHGVTTLMTWETRDLLHGPSGTPSPELSSMIENLVLLRQVEAAARVRREVTVLKLRAGEHDCAVREFVITGRGIEVPDLAEGAPTAPGGGI